MYMFGQVRILSKLSAKFKHLVRERNAIAVKTVQYLISVILGPLYSQIHTLTYWLSTGELKLQERHITTGKSPAIFWHKVCKIQYKVVTTTLRWEKTQFSQLELDQSCFLWSCLTSMTLLDIICKNNWHISEGTLEFRQNTHYPTIGVRERKI